MEHRSENDVICAVEVFPVILFHAGFELFGGGFVGVDVFIVISGYGWDHKRVSLALSSVKFVAKRPRDFVVCAFSPATWGISG